ncbi:hypothetical protein LTR53_014623 [Teratosphaeriaceae sp. CCFEE 6253]|nr:hypothetical protein LTR53_014623 [Teratosphaeriaceae sp. CCFEE 6253]
MSSQRQPRPSTTTTTTAFQPDRTGAPSDDFQVLCGFVNAPTPTTDAYPPPVTKPTSATAPRPSKTLTGLAPEPLNILILGASYAGLACAHHFLDTTLACLRRMPSAPTYRLIIVSPSTHLYWNIAAPRALVASGLLAQEEVFVPVEPGFHRHRGERFTILQGTCVAFDPEARTVRVELLGAQATRRCSQVTKRLSRPAGVDGEEAKVQTLAYHALILATGSAAHSELLSLHGPHLNTLGALHAFRARVAGAKSVVVCGGGCSGVETAGQLATFLNYTSHWLLKKRVKAPKHIILITGAARCLPALPPKLGQQAEAQLKRLGVDVRHGVRVREVKPDFDLTGATRVELSDGRSVVADLYLPCTGSEPNTAYVPPALLDSKGYVRSQGGTMRVQGGGARVYAVGDVAAYSRNCLQDVYAAVPVLMHNLRNDLLAHELRLDSPYGGNAEAIAALRDEVYVPRPVESQLVPITRFGGVGVLRGKVMPSRLVYLLKGHDYRVAKAGMVVEEGRHPYAFKTAGRSERK